MQLSVDAAPDALVLMPCGWDVPQTKSRVHELRVRDGFGDIPAVRRSNVWAVNGSAYFNRPGPRVVRGAEILASILHGRGRVAPDEAVRA